MEYKGLTSKEAEDKLKLVGSNEIPQKKQSLLVKFLKYLISPISLMLFLASILSFTLGKDFDGDFILVLLFLNIVITFWQEQKADNAIKKLNENLEQKIKVLRDEKWSYVSSVEIVPGDVTQLAIGEVIPADGEILEANNVSINESALTGESMPKDKNNGDKVFSGSFLSTGLVIVRITETGARTQFGKTLFSVDRVKKQSLLEKDIIGISKFLTVISLIAVAILSVIFLINKEPVLELITLDLSLVIAGIPISLPTVMTLIIEFGVLSLAAKDVIVRRLSALEDLANVNFLLTDKTGTLTKNKITVQDIYAHGDFDHNDVLLFASIVASLESDNPIDMAILEKQTEAKIKIADYSKIKFTPADSDRKRSTAVVKLDGKNMTISLGAPQIIESLCNIDGDTKGKFNEEIETLAKSGYRTLAVATSDSAEEKDMKLVGLLALSDTLRPDAKSVIEFLIQNGIGVAMVTGDNKAIAANVVNQLKFIGSKIISKQELDKTNWDEVTGQYFQNAAAFAEILPQDKFMLVEKAKKFFVVAANGDGVNDLPALKAANIGIAVKSAVNALKATADIVLLSDGIAVISDAILESKKIFEKLYTYSLYRISESLRLIITIAVLGILLGRYPMTALQIILIALLNDIPIISLAFDRVKVATRPSKINVKSRFILSSLYGLTGIFNSLILFFIMQNFLHLDWRITQTLYFLKLTVSGHMLIYVAHTKERWFRFLPSKEVIIATSITQGIATLLALSGFLMPAKVPIMWVVFVWVWAFLWMQISEITKEIHKHFTSIH